MWCFSLKLSPQTMDQFIASFSKLDTNEKRTIEDIVQYISDKSPKNIICMTGAGISTSCGIPDFRSKSGVYQQDLDVPYPEAVFELSYFKKEPKPFFKLAKQLYGHYSPSPTHYFLKLLHEKKILRRIYTQNIDALERIAEIPHQVLVEAHGTFSSSTCLGCKKTFDTAEIVVPKIEINEIPYCACGGVIKPDIVFFGENLPCRFFELYESDFEKCDLLIILGTSLVVQPFAHLIDLVDHECPRLLLNFEKVGDGFGDRPFDVVQLGKCDDLVHKLVNMLKWDIHFNEILLHRVDLLDKKEKDMILRQIRKDVLTEKNNNSNEGSLDTQLEEPVRKLSIQSLASDVSGFFSPSVSSSDGLQLVDIKEQEKQ